MDLSMPVMDGIEATREILKVSRRNSSEENIKIVALTANDTPADRKRCQDVGMYTFMSKPPDSGKLRKTLHEVFKDDP
jgi:CheY-like chemotaxis protein